jgi:hypothetical protein
MRPSRDRTPADATVELSRASLDSNMRSSLGAATREPKDLLSARRPEADPLALHLIEMHSRIVFGDCKSECRDVQPANR